MKKKLALEIISNKKVKAPLGRSVDKDLALRREGYASHLWLRQFDDDGLSLSGEQLRIEEAVIEIGRILDRIVHAPTGGALPGGVS